MLSVNLMAAGCEGGFNWYGFLIGSGMVICIILAYFMGIRRGYYKDLVFDIAIICIPLAIVGARLYYVIFDILGNGADDWTVARFFGLDGQGLAGLAIYGGLIGACLGGLIVHLWKRKKPEKDKATFLQMADLAFTVIILGQAIGRWGNFANQEAYGYEVTNAALQWFPFAVEINGVWHLATFFYESFFNVIGFALLMWIYNGKRKSFDGFSLSCYCIWYGLVRFFIEGLRTDSLYLWLGGLRVSQLLSAVLVLFGIGFIVAHVYMARNKGLKPFIMVPRDKLDSSYYGYDSCILAHPNVYEKKKNGFWARLFGKGEDLPEVELEGPEVLDANNDDDLADDLKENLEGLEGLQLEGLSEEPNDGTKLETPQTTESGNETDEPKKEEGGGEQ